jgi:hypothetical protein
LQRICSNQNREGVAENHGKDSAINAIFGAESKLEFCSCIL